MLINKTIIMLILCSHVGAKEPRKGKEGKKRGIHRSFMYVHGESVKSTRYCQPLRLR